MASITSALRKWARITKNNRAKGLHQEFFAAAAFLIEEGNSEERIFELLRAAANTVDERIVPDREIRGAIRGAMQKVTSGETTTRWPKLGENYRAEIVAAYMDKGREMTSQEASLSQEPAFYLEALYRPANLVCGGYSAFEFVTRMRNEIRDYALNGVNFEYINPSPMSAFVGTNKDGAVSDHTENNTGPKVYQVVEFDTGAIQEHAAILAHLSKRLPLALMVYSGGKSIHGWFYCKDAPLDFLTDFFSDACSLGADPTLWSKSQFSRMPGMTNAKTRKRQAVLYYNSEFTLNGK